MHWVAVVAAVSVCILVLLLGVCLLGVGRLTINYNCDYCLGLKYALQSVVRKNMTQLTPGLQVDLKVVIAAGHMPWHDELPPSNAEVPKTILVTYKSRHALPHNVLPRLQQLNPEFLLTFMGDDDAVRFLEREYTPWHAERFRETPDGPIKADWLRLLYLVKHGGYYCDADMIPTAPLPVCESGGILVPYDGRSSDRNLLNPCFIGAAPRHPVMHNCVRLAEYVFRHNPYTYWGHSIVHLLSFVNFKMNFPIPRRLVEQWPVRWHSRDNQITSVDRSVVFFESRDPRYNQQTHKYTSCQ
uniref:Alpha 1,4-glycosyltransferase domain-containing protein n=1 Tax=viral metagenome TaxID=1070528 RepID=A0A6C0KEX3_9ZZZZ